MNRISVELPIAATAATMMASMILVGGIALEVPSRPTALADRRATSPTVDVGGCLEAPVTSTTGISGTGTLCDGDDAFQATYDLQVTLEVNGLVPGGEYTAWLGFALGAPCPDASCEAHDPPIDSSGGMLKLVGSGIASPSGTLKLRGELGDARRAGAARVSLLLVRPGAEAGPHARALFILP